MLINKAMDYSSPKLPLLLERVGVRRIKSISYNPIIPTFSLKGEGARVQEPVLVSIPTPKAYLAARFMARGLVCLVFMAMPVLYNRIFILYLCVFGMIVSFDTSRRSNIYNNI